MSAARKFAGARCPRPSHVHQRHGSAAPPPPPPGESPPAELARLSIMFDGRHLGDVHVPPGIDQELISRAVDLLATRTKWGKLGADLAALGPHRLAIAARAATASASGGRGMSAEEEAHLARWFAGTVEEALRRGGLPAAVAIWVILAGDSHADPVHGRSARCPAIAELPLPPKGFSFEPSAPGESGESSGMTPDPEEVATFLAKVRAAAPSYVHTAIACASDADLRDLREIATAADIAADTLEEFRPWGVDLAAEAPASALLEDARAMLTYRHLSNAETCSGFADWAHGLAGMVAEHALSPVLRIGAVAWLAHVALRPEEGAACDSDRPEEEAACDSGRPEEEETACDSGRPEEEATSGNEHDLHARPYVRHCMALEGAGWHVVELRPSGTDELALWRVTIERYDKGMTMTIREAADPDVALEELVRYTRVDVR